MAKDKTRRQIFIDYRENVKEALAFDIIRLADRPLDPERIWIVSKHAGKLEALREVGRLIPDDTAPEQPPLPPKPTGCSEGDT